jgi:hypothetical protein
VEIMTRPTPCIPALRFDWLTRFYGPILRATLKEEPLKLRIVEQVGCARDAHDHAGARLPRG